MDSDLPKTPFGLNAPVPLFWFEFLLNPALLEEHLNKEKPGILNCCY